jgi:S-adenosylmethionine hydrolase
MLRLAHWWALIGSSDHLEIAVRNGSAAQKRWGAGIGDIVRVFPASHQAA